MVKVGDIVNYNKILWLRVLKIEKNMAVCCPLYDDDLKHIEKAELFPLKLLKPVKAETAAR